MNLPNEIQCAGHDDSYKTAEPEPVRCICNKLLFIRYDNVIEIKCNKCKRMIKVYTKGIERIDIS